MPDPERPPEPTLVEKLTITVKEAGEKIGKIKFVISGKASDVRASIADPAVWASTARKTYRRMSSRGNSRYYAGTIDYAQGVYMACTAETIGSNDMRRLSEILYPDASEVGRDLCREHEDMKEDAFEWWSGEYE